MQGRRHASHVHITYERPEIIAAVLAEVRGLRSPNGRRAKGLSVDLNSALISRLLFDSPKVLEAFVAYAQSIFGNSQELTLAERHGVNVRQRQGLEVVETQGASGRAAPEHQRHRVDPLGV